MLSEQLKVLLASSYAFVVKAQQFHWNVEGPDFPQYHEFFGDLYAEVYGVLDKIAEYIRTLDAYTPGSFERYAELSVIKGQTKIPRAELMFEELNEDNEMLMKLLEHCFETAGQERQFGIENFLAERLDAHAKHRWMIKSILKKERA